MSYESHLYQILSPNQALVASQLSPELFAKHFTIGSARYYEGKVIFAELDIEFRNSYFDIEQGLAGLVPHEDGRPKATKYISTYRTLEHLDFNVVKKLYLTSAEGYCIGLSEAPHEAKHDPGYIRTYAEIAPMRMLALSRLDFPEFGKYITNPEYTKSAPKLFYTQIELNIDHFLEEFDRHPTLPSPVPGVHPAKLRNAIQELRDNLDKPLKGVSLDIPLEKIAYKSLRHGFMFASQQTTKFFPMPTMAEIEELNFNFWRRM